MPHVNIWIREEDWDFWKEIEDRPSFIHDAIRVQRQSIVGSIYKKGVTSVPGGKVVVNSSNITEKPFNPTIDHFGTDKTNRSKIIKTPADATKKVEELFKAKPMDFCPNGHSIPEGRTKCMGKGCKYS